MAQSRTVPSRLYQPGERTIDLRSIPADSGGIRITLTRETWPEANPAVDVIVRYSQDAGATWGELGRASFPGGNLTGRDGQPLLASWFERAWSGEWDGLSRRAFRGTDIEITFINRVALTTAVSIDSIAVDAARRK